SSRRRHTRSDRDWSSDVCSSDLWEGVGLCSYLLIGFWYSDAQKAFAGRKAFVVNRVGDFGFLLGVFSIFALFGTSEYQTLARLKIGRASCRERGLVAEVGQRVAS